MAQPQVRRLHVISPRAELPPKVVVSPKVVVAAPLPDVTSAVPGHIEAPPAKLSRRATAAANATGLGGLPVRRRLDFVFEPLPAGQHFDDSLDTHGLESDRNGGSTSSCLLGSRLSATQVRPELVPVGNPPVAVVVEPAEGSASLEMHVGTPVAERADLSESDWAPDTPPGNAASATQAAVWSPDERGELAAARARALVLADHGHYTCSMEEWTVRTGDELQAGTEGEPDAGQSDEEMEDAEAYLPDE